MPISLTSPNNFSSLTLQNLVITFGIKESNSLVFPSQPTNYNLEILQEIVDSAKDEIDSWTEQELIIKHLSAILKIANLKGENYNTFAGRPIGADVEGVELSGYVDFLVASGRYEPVRPYFFVHEFKKSINHSGDPFAQLIGELLVAKELNQDNNSPVYGLVVIGRLWYFVILNQKEFTRLQPLNSTDMDDLQVIFDKLAGIKQYIEIEVKK